MTTNDPTACATCGHSREWHDAASLRHLCMGTHVGRFRAFDCPCTAYVAALALDGGDPT